VTALRGRRFDVPETSTSKTVSPPSPGETVVYGVFKGMGDLLAAAPVIVCELNAGSRVILVVFRAVIKLVELLDFGDNRGNLDVTIFPGLGSFTQLVRFVTDAARWRPDFVWISPHSPIAARSRNVPMFFFFMRRTFWRKAVLAGADTERLSQWFDLRVRVDRGLPLATRESTAYSLARWNGQNRVLGVSFKPSLHAYRQARPEFDVVVHPGANADNRKWPIAHFVTLIKTLSDNHRIGVVGLPQDLDGIRAALPAVPGIQYIEGSLEEAIASIAKARVLLAMDSGTKSFASILGVPTVALYGPVDPATVLEGGGVVFPIYEKKWPCQPCGDSRCSQSTNYCLTSIEPGTVSAALLARLRREDAVLQKPIPCQTDH
jgi:hypothetical protein